MRISDWSSVVCSSRLVGRVLVEHGLRVVTALGGRSARTEALAAGAGLVALPDDSTLVGEADILLSILPPAHAVASADRIAGALRATGAGLLFVDSAEARRGGKEGGMTV